MALNVFRKNSKDYFILAVIAVYIKDTKGLARSFFCAGIKKNISDVVLLLFQ